MISLRVEFLPLLNTRLCRPVWSSWCRREVSDIGATWRCNLQLAAELLAVIWLKVDGLLRIYFPLSAYVALTTLPSSTSDEVSGDGSTGRGHRQVAPLAPLPNDWADRMYITNFYWSVCLRLSNYFQSKLSSLSEKASAIGFRATWETVYRVYCQFKLCYVLLVCFVLSCSLCRCTKAIICNNSKNKNKKIIRLKQVLASNKQTWWLP